MAILVAIQAATPLTDEQLQAVQRYHKQVLKAPPQLRYVFDHITIFFDGVGQAHSLAFVSSTCGLSVTLVSSDMVQKDCGSSNEPVPLSGLNFDAQKWEQRIAELEEKYRMKAV